jgi:tRNA-dihydrouridine synthase 2
LFIDLVYSPEIVDKALIGCERVVNGNSDKASHQGIMFADSYICVEETGVIEYIKLGQKIFTTHPKEKSRLILQLGTADPQLALQAALLVRDDVAAIDVNSGCPKRFSLQGGMGAALLSEPDRLVKVTPSIEAHAHTRADSCLSPRIDTGNTGSTFGSSCLGQN